jgi:hypothetical protein
MHIDEAPPWSLVQAFLRGYGDFEEGAMMTLTRPWLIIPGLDCDEYSYLVVSRFYYTNISLVRRMT